jgi:hypothetical protein
MNDTPVSKMLVLDSSPLHAPRIKQFCDDHNLVAHTVRKGSEIAVLRTNIDLGGILFAEDYGDSPEDMVRIALLVHHARPELPIIIRREARANLDGLPDSVRHVFCAAYVAGDMDALGKLIEQHVFCLTYPNALVRGIAELTHTVLCDEFKSLTVRMSSPYIVQDRVIFGELFSLMPLESSWCRGYMMLQCEEDPLLDLSGEDGIFGSAASIRAMNSRLSEVTNRIWGAFKGRYVGDDQTSVASLIQIPLIVNHKHRYVSFGTVNPQLCFRFEFIDAPSGLSWELFARFIFSLNWSPEGFKEIDHSADELVDAGEMQVL